MITIVLGMHRSGTSTIAGILHLNKIIMGTYQNFWPRPLNQNPKGFYENYDFRKINDIILNNVGYNVKSYEENIPEIVLDEKIKTKMQKLIKKYSLKFPCWGWKDPRTGLTIIEWFKIIKLLGFENQIKIVYVSRKALAVARSLNKRNNLSLRKGLLLWEVYSKSAVKFCEKINVPVFYCSFEDLLKSPRSVCIPLFEFLEKDLDLKVINTFVDRSISKNNQGDDYPQSRSISLLEQKINKLILK